MNLRHLLSLMLIVIISIPMTGWGQSAYEGQEDNSKTSLLFPIVPDATDIIGTPDSPITDGVIEQIYNRCLTRIPPRFTPDSHKFYCTCSAAATQGNITVGELTQLQKAANRKLGNKAFEKYIHTVMKPCMDTAVEDTEYMYCLTYRSNDWRIKYPLPYCKCVSRKVREFFVKNGEEDMMISWGSNKRMMYKDPIESMWANARFQSDREQSRSYCVGHYLNPEFYKD